MNDTRVFDYDIGEYALCPFTDNNCRMECMLMRPTGLGEPRCSFRVIADELVLFDKKREEGGDGLDAS